MPTEQLRDEFERATLLELLVEWATANNHLSRWLLPLPVLTLVDSDTILGRWQRTGRLIELSRKLVFEQPWTTVLEVLKREMAHQFGDEVLRLLEPSAHDADFAAVCRERGIDPRAAGLTEAHDPRKARQAASLVVGEAKGIIEPGPKDAVLFDEIRAMLS